jgi:anaerobic selenocysteine-containing dehydrogenase
MDLKRRSFLKAVGLTAAGSLLPGCGRETHKIIPYLLPDDEIVPGVDNWYASVCQECDAGCGIIVRVMEGRARKIEGNPAHPLNQGKLCAMGQASLQGLYNPDRIRGPLQREGGRGEGKFKPISWEDGISRWVAALQKHPGRTAMISRSVPGTLGDLFSQFMEGIGGRLLFYDPSEEMPLRTANRLTFGIDFDPDYNIANTTYLLSFGAPFLSHWLSPVRYGIAYGKMRQGRPTVRGRFVQVEPRLSLTAAGADRWIPIRPGTEGLLAIGLGQVILKEGQSRLAKGDRSGLERFYNSFSLDRISAETGIAKEVILKLAEEFSTAAAPLAIGGGMAAAQTNGTDTLRAVNALNLLVGNLGRPGGIRFFQPAERFPSGKSAPVAEQALIDLKDQFRRKERTVLMLYQANPLFTLPPSTQFRQLFDEAAFIVSFSPFMDESTAMADLILPDHFFLEAWGDHRNEGIVQAVGLSQPVVIPLYDTRSVGDLFLSAADRLGGAMQARLPWIDFRTMLREQWRGFLNHHHPGPPETAWVEQLQRGGWWREEPEPMAIGRQNLPTSMAPARFEGDEKAFPYYFYPFPSMGLDQGQGANRPWLQELPDPMTTVIWGSWVEINPKTAQEHGLRERDLVRVISPYGELEAPVIFYPGIRPDLISMPIGQGHAAFGRYAKNRGANPLSLLAPQIDPPSGALATGATRVRIERTGRKGKPVLVDQTGEGTKRNPGEHPLIEIPV